MSGVMTAHQPNFLPYLGFFDKMLKSDVFVIRDEVQFVKSDYHHRNRIRIPDLNGEPRSVWLTVPVEKSDADLKDIVIKRQTAQGGVPWARDMYRQIEANYRKTPFFAEFAPKLERILNDNHARLLDLNMDVIAMLMDAFGIKREVVLASKLPGYEKTGDATLDLVALTKAAGCDAYLSGAGGKGYLREAEFPNAGIALDFQHYEHPTYPQRYPGFVPYMGAIDALFCTGTLPGNNH